MFNALHSGREINFFSQAPAGDSSKNFGCQILTFSRHFFMDVFFFTVFSDSTDDHVHVIFIIVLCLCTNKLLRWARKTLHIRKYIINVKAASVTFPVFLVL